MSAKRKTFSRNRPTTASNLGAKRVVVDMAAMAVSDDPSAVLITYALGSCIAVIVHDPRRLVGGMLHYMLPLSKTSPEKAEQNPAMFADVGIPALFERMYSMGCQKSDLVVKVTGGGKLWDDKGTFDIGKRNYTVMRKMFWKNNVLISGEDIGGAKSRTVQLFVATGEVRVRAKGEEVTL